jgi:16S rRNA (guanine966-N2)-methyltransferase
MPTIFFISGFFAWSSLERPWDQRFDIVFLDPPFAEDRGAELCRLVADAGLLAPGALVYLEEPRDRPEAALPDGWAVEKQKTAGKVRYQLLKPAG